MARPKEFDRELAIQSAMQVFWDKGYDGASTEALTSAMGIGRQSMYDTYGDKQKLYFEALRRYHQQNGGSVRERLVGAASPLDGIRVVLLAMADREEAESARGCMGINATTAFGHYFPDVLAMALSTAETVERAFMTAVVDAQHRGEVAASLDAKAAAQFLYTTLQGLTVRAQAGATREALRNSASFAIEALTTMR